MIDKLKGALSAIQPALNSSIVQVKHGGVIFAYAGALATPQSKFYIGELTQQMTAFMLLSVLKEKNPDVGLMTLAQKNVYELFPNSTILSILGEDLLKNISLLNLLTHNSGLTEYLVSSAEYFASPTELATQYPDLITNPNVLVEKVDFTEMYAHKLSAKQLLCEVKHLDFPAANESQTNYFILGKLLEELTGKSYEGNFNEFIKSPVGISNTYAVTQGNFEALKKLPQFINLQPDNADTHHIDLGNLIGTGNVISTAEDLLKWNAFFYNDVDASIRDFMLLDHAVDVFGDVMRIGMSSDSDFKFKDIGMSGNVDSYTSTLYTYNSEYEIVTLSNDEADQALIDGALQSVLLPEVA